MSEPETQEPPSLQDLVPADSPGMDTVSKKGYKTAADVVKAYGELTRLHTGQKYKVPGKNMEDQDWRTFYSQMGAPEDPDGYSLPEAGDETKKLLGELRETAFQNGLTKAQWEALSGKAAELQGSAEAQYMEALEKTQKEWQSEAEEKYGKGFAEALAKAERAYTNLFGTDSEIDKFLVQTKLKNHPSLIQAMMDVGERVSEDRTPGTKSEGGGVGGKDRALEVAARIKELNLGEELNNPHHPRKNLAMAELQKLHIELRDLGFEGANDPRLRVDPFSL